MLNPKLDLNLELKSELIGGTKVRAKFRASNERLNGFQSETQESYVVTIPQHYDISNV